MKKNLLTAFLFLVLLNVRGQTVYDSLHVNPNPFSQRTLVTYTITGNDTITLEIFNIAGVQVLAPRTNYIVTAGVYQDSLIMDNFPDGVYFLILKNKQRSLRNLKIIKSVSTALREREGDLHLSVYPNPVTDKLNIEILNYTAGGQLHIYNFFGQDVYYLNRVSQYQQLELGHLPGGIYFLEIDTPALQIIYKVVKE